MHRSGLAFIASHLEVRGPIPFNILPSFILRAATADEISTIRFYLGERILPDTKHWVRYAHTIKQETFGSTTTYKCELLPVEQWKYWVIAFDGDDETLQEIELVGQLLPFYFDIAFVFYYSENNQQGSVVMQRSMPSHIVEIYGSFEQATSNAQSLNSQQFAAVKNNIDAYRRLDKTYSFIESALRNFADLKRVPEKSDLIVVGLFAIVESLITHLPYDTLNSINRQLTSKMMLLRKRYNCPVDIPKYFKRATEETIWKKLYAFRSAIAHGSDGFSQLGSLLVSRRNVILFLRDNIKELLILALHEPMLISDLRRC